MVYIISISYTLITYPIGPHNGGLLYTRLEGADDETVGAKIGPPVGGNANDGALNGEAEFNGGPVLRLKLLKYQKIEFKINK